MSYPSNDTLKQKAMSIFNDSQEITMHSSALYYAKDCDDVDFHVTWIKWYYSRMKEVIDNLDDVGF